MSEGRILASYMSLDDYELLDTGIPTKFSTVYRAEHKQSGESVAVKLCTKPDLVNPHWEIKANDAVKGKWRPRLRDHFPHETAHALVFDYVEGKRLEEVLQSHASEEWQPYRDELALKVGLGICSALGLLHTANILHLDVKPRNILLAPRGATLIDLGISRNLEEYNADTSDYVFGTIAYLAPEQLKRGGTASPATDIWSVGVTLYEGVSGRQPFGEENEAETAVIDKIRFDEPNMSAVPIAWREIISKCLSKNPAQRYQTAALMRRDLKELRKEIIRKDLLTTKN